MCNYTPYATQQLATLIEIRSDFNPHILLGGEIDFQKYSWLPVEDENQNGKQFLVLGQIFQNN